MVTRIHLSVILLDPTLLDAEVSETDGSVNPPDCPLRLFLLRSADVLNYLGRIGSGTVFA